MRKFWPIILTVLSVLSGILGQFEVLLNWFFEIRPEHLLWWKIGFTALAAIYPVIVLPVQYWKLERKMERYKEFAAISIAPHRDEFLTRISPVFYPEEAVINIRILLPVRGFGKYFWRRIFLGEKYFQIIENDKLCNDISARDLCFRVKPDPQGVVGKAFANGRIYYDNNVLESRKQMNLNEFQLRATRNVRFVAAMVLMNSRNEKTGILSIDTETEIELLDDEFLENMMIRFGILIEKYLPLVEEK